MDQSTLLSGKKETVRYGLWLVGIFLLYIALSCPHLLNPNVFEPDADRIAMDGIFLLDFVKDLPHSLLNVYDYTTRYYAKYPALSIGYRPIFFPLVEAFFYWIFGFSYFSARLGLFFFLFFGMLYWFLLVREIDGPRTATLSLLLWLTNPMVYELSQQPMLEIPTLSMCIISIYYLYIFERQPNTRHAVILGIVVGLTLWTNQKAGFILPLLFLYPITQKNFKLLIHPKTLLAGGIILVFFIPLAFLTLWLGEQNLSQSIGTASSSSWYAKLKLFKNISYLYETHFSYPLLVLMLIGGIAAIKDAHRKYLIFLCGIFCVYLFFSIIKAKVPRYPMYWIPMFCLFAAVGLEKLMDHLKNFSKRRIYTLRFLNRFGFLMLGLPILFQLAQFPNIYVGSAKGYDAAARYVLKNTHSPVIFFHGYLNGQFIFFVRKNDPKRSAVILRGSKMITSSSVRYTNQLKVHLNDAAAIYQRLSDYGVHFVVVESKNISGVPIFDDLRQMLKDTSRFKLHRKITIKGNRKLIEGQKILIYENLAFKNISENRVLDLKLPIVGKTIRVKLKKITQ